MMLWYDCLYPHWNKLLSAAEIILITCRPDEGEEHVQHPSVNSDSFLNLESLSFFFFCLKMSSDDIKVNHNKSTNQSLECRYKDFLFYNLLTVASWCHQSSEQRTNPPLFKHKHTRLCLPISLLCPQIQWASVCPLLTSPHFCPLSCDAGREEGWETLNKAPTPPAKKDFCFHIRESGQTVLRRNV